MLGSSSSGVDPHGHLPGSATPPPGSEGNPLGAGDSSGEDSDEREGRIRVGKDYQANTPPLIPSIRELI